MTTRAAAATALDAESLSTTGVPLADAAESPTRTLRTRLRKASTASGSADKENAATQPPRTAAPTSTSAGVAAATTTVVVSVPTVAVAVSAPGPPAELGAPRTLNLIAPRRDGGPFLLVAAIGRPKKSTGGLWGERKRRQRNGGVHGCVK